MPPRSGPAIGDGGAIARQGKSCRQGYLLYRHTMFPSVSAGPSAASQLSEASPHASLSRSPTGCGSYKKTRSEEHTSELQSLMRISYAVFCLNKKIIPINKRLTQHKNHTQQSSE